MALVAVAGGTMAEGFLGRWAQRKADARDGKPLTEPVPMKMRMTAAMSVVRWESKMVLNALS